jgi:cytoskeletal protein RodZ
MEEGRNTQTSAGDPLDGEPKIGRILEQTRRDRGLSLDEVEQATKIRKRYLTGLEREDYAMLPDAVYAQGFLKTYANFLGLDGEELSRQLRNRRKPRRERGINHSSRPSSDFERPLITPGGVSGTEKRRFSTSAVVTLIVAVLALAAIIGTLYYVGRGVQITQAREDAPANVQTAEDAPDNPPVERRDPSSEDGLSATETEPVDRGEGGTGEAAGQGTTVAEQSAPPETLLVSVTVTERPSWLLIRADGALAYEETAPPGFTQTFEAERQLSITSGDAGAVTVEVNGQEAGALGAMGDVVTKNFTLKSAS